jgi:hypothetical protein
MGLLVLGLVYGALVWFLARSGFARAAVAFGVAPVAPAVVAAVVGKDVLPLVLFTPFSYLFSLAGVPFYFLFRKLGWLHFWSIVPTSALLGALAAFPLNAVTFNGGVEVTNLHNLLLFVEFGALVGAVFWFIALSPLPKNERAA